MRRLLSEEVIGDVVVAADGVDVDVVDIDHDSVGVAGADERESKGKESSEGKFRGEEERGGGCEGQGCKNCRISKYLGFRILTICTIFYLAFCNSDKGGSE